METLTTVVVILGIVVMVLLAGLFFLAKELMKKFGFFNEFAADSPNFIKWVWCGAKNYGVKPGMRNVVLRSDHYFKVLIGFHLKVPFFGTGFDYYGFAEAKKAGSGIWEMVMSTYCGNGSCEFKFFCDRKVGKKMVVLWCDSDVWWKKPDVVYQPHWWQRLGFWG